MSTIRQVAKACGVSPMTVSFVINNRSDQVSSGTRERVLRAVRELGYRPPASSMPRRRPMMTFGYISGAQTNTLLRSGYHGAMMHAVLDAAEELRHNITIFNRSLLGNNLQRSIRFYCDGRCDALLAVSPGIGNPLTHELRERGFPFILIGDTSEHLRADIVDVDSIAGTTAVVEHLLALGHKRIAFCGAADPVTSVAERYNGFVETLNAANVPVALEMTKVRFGSYHEIGPWATQLFTRQPRPSAIFAWNDRTAQIVWEAARDQGVRVPGDLSIAGFDDDGVVGEHFPELTTVAQPYASIGKEAVEILVSRVRGDRSPPATRLLPGKLIVRGSTAPVKG